MLGLGETESEIYETLEDLLKTGCSIVTIGQYMRPSRNNLPVEEYVKPVVFEKYKIAAEKMGFKIVESAPLVRSSFNASKYLVD